MKKIDELITKLNDEFALKNDKHSANTKDLLLMEMIVNFFEDNRNVISQELVNKILKEENILETLCQTFKDYVFMDNLFFDIFEDAYLYDHDNQDDIRELFFYDDVDDYLDVDIDEDDEGFIHDNEDC